MNYFIDFEATQFSNGIISVGCINEVDSMFYTLVSTKHKVTPFITDLTGITAEDVKEAPSPEAVFEAFYDWVMEDCKDEKPHFYCYGNCDKDFVKNNFKECNNFKASTMLAYLYTDMEDYSGVVKRHFGLHQNIGLKKIYDYYTGKQTVQRHNALEDAKMLRTVHHYIQINDNEFDAFPEAVNAKFNERMSQEVSLLITDKEKHCQVLRIKSNKTVETYNSFEDAVRWCYNQIPEGPEREKTSLKTIAKRIRSANNLSKKYRNFKWKIV